MHPSLLRLLLLILTACCIMGTMATATTKPDDLSAAERLDGFDDFILQKMGEYEVPGAVVGIVEDDQIRFLKGFGVRRLGEPGVIDPDTRFQIASVTKYLTGAAIGTLVDEGKLNWDTPVVHYLPDFKLNDTYAGNHSTLRDMLAHRTGFKSYDGELLGRVGYSPDEIMRRIQYLAPGASFRERYLYSNIGYYIAGEAAAAVDGRSWEDLMDARIIGPLGMTRSGSRHETLYLDENHFSGHGGEDGNIQVIPLEYASLPAAGQVVSTGRDMTRWLRMMLNEGSIDGEQIVTPDTVKKIHAASMVAGPSGPLRDPNGAIGLGCDSYYFLGERIIEKNGALDGVRSVVVLIPGEKSGIVVIANKQLTAFPEAVRDEFLERFIGRTGVDLQAREKASQAGWDSLIKKPVRPVPSEPSTIDSSAISGVYNSELYGNLQIDPGTDGEHMIIGLGPNRYPGNLTYWTDDTWYLSWPNPDDQAGFITILADSAGMVTGFVSDDFGPFDRV